jgi:Bacteriocin-protection, YdeI or OmpD-Associated/Domain of unknown function (DUF1905)
MLPTAKASKRAISPALHRFMATIYKIRVMRHVNVPEEIAQALATACGSLPAKERKRRPDQERRQTKPKYIPVIAIVNARSARTTLVPAGGGRYRLQLNTALRKAARADVGDVVSVELDLEPRTASAPADLQVALKSHPTARKTFNKLPPGHRRQFLIWVQGAKGPQARKHRLEKAIDHLLERALLRPPARAPQTPPLPLGRRFRPTAIRYAQNVGVSGKLGAELSLLV